MSNALAIASVTAVIKDLLDNAAIDGALSGNIKVTVLPPDMVKDGDNKNDLGLNLFMYAISPNTGWRNHGLPSADAGGRRIDHNPLAIDLFYLLTAYGKASYDAEILLGYAMQLLHEQSVLSRQSIRESLSKSKSALNIPLSGLKDMSASDLGDQVELIKIIPHQISAEEISKLWAAFQTNYRPSVAYQVSVVLIESKDPARRALPVSDQRRGRGIYPAPRGRPLIERISSRKDKDSDIVAGQPVLSGYTLAIYGSGLIGDATKVRLGGRILDSAHVLEAGDSRILALIPDDMPAGIQSAQVLHSIKVGEAFDEERLGMESNAMPFILCPSIIDQAVTVTDTGKVISVWLTPKVGREQRVILYLNELQVPPTGDAHAYSFRPPSNNGVHDRDDDTDCIDFTVEGVASGTYLLRVQVDGAESPLDAAGDDGYDSPQVDVP